VPESGASYILTEAANSKSSINRCCLEKTLSNDWQKPNHAEASEQVSKAREAAEALFRPKQQAIVEISTGQASAGSEIHRKPRVIPIRPGEPHRETVEAVAKPTSQRGEIQSRIRKIPKSEYGRVRALASYGMTLEQVAALYEVSATQIERIVSATSDTDVNSSQIGRDHDPRGQGERGGKRIERGPRGDAPEAASD